MITYEKALSIVEENKPINCSIAFSAEDKNQYIFILRRKDYEFDKNRYGVYPSYECSVDKETGKWNPDSAVFQFYKLFMPEKLPDLKKTIKKVEELS